MKRYDNVSDEVTLSSDETIQDKHVEVEDVPEQDVPVSPEESMEDVEKSTEEYSEPEKRQWKFSLPPRDQLLTALAFWGVILLAAVLRFWGLGDKPLHHDESLHAYYSMQQMLRNNLQNWASCLNVPPSAGICYRYDPLLHGPFQFHAIAIVYQISQWLHAPDNGINTTTVRLAAASLGTVIVGLPYFLRHQLGKVGAWIACFLLAVSPSLVYFSRFAREDIYMACFTLLLVVSIVQYLRKGKAGWLVLAFLAFALSYATKEATFLTIGVFGSFFGALLVWEIASRFPVYRQQTTSAAPLAIAQVGGRRESAFSEVPALAPPEYPQTPSNSVPKSADTASVGLSESNQDPKTHEQVESAGDVQLTEFPEADHEPTAENGENVLKSPSVESLEENVEDVDALPEIANHVQTVPVADVNAQRSSALRPWFVPKTFAPLALLGYFLVLGVIAKLFLDWLKNLSIFLNASKTNLAVGDKQIAQLKNVTDLIVPWLGIVLAIVVFVILLREQFAPPSSERRGLARLVDPVQQPLLNRLVTMPWTHWFFALVAAWTVFLVLFTALFTYMPGIGDGVWQGLYYWIQQQQVARGGQPWYYYFLLIPLYEQIGLVFGIVGIVRCLWHPTRFRLFLVYWFVGNVFIYSWAGEKMPWLSIHMTMPMMLLAALGLEPAVTRVWVWVRAQISRTRLGQIRADARGQVPVTPALGSNRQGSRPVAGAFVTVFVALVLLLLTLQNMFQLTYVHYADGPNEMMIYVQTTKDVNTVMDKLAQVDKKFYGGQHKMPIGLMSDAAWPYFWYLRDYTSICFPFPAACSTTANTIPVIIAAYADNLPDIQQQYSRDYAYHQYELRSQWNQGYMPPPCVPSATNKCTENQQYTGGGPWLWLTYGAAAQDAWAKHEPFNLDLSLQHVWQWWWQRTPIGGVDSGYAMGLLIRKDVGVAP